MDESDDSVRAVSVKCNLWRSDEPMQIEPWGFAPPLPITSKMYLHGWGYAEEQYKDGLLRAVETLKKCAPDAKLIWATTTPVSEPGNVSQISERTERVKARNNIAAAIMQERGIPTDDLYGLVEPHPDWHSSDGTHFNGKGKEAQAKAVAESVLKRLDDDSEKSD